MHNNLKSIPEPHSVSSLSSLIGSSDFDERIRNIMEDVYSDGHKTVCIVSLIASVFISLFCSGHIELENVRYMSSSKKSSQCLVKQDSNDQDLEQSVSETENCFDISFILIVRPCITCNYIYLRVYDLSRKKMFKPIKIDILSLKPRLKKTYITKIHITKRTYGLLREPLFPQKVKDKQ